MSSIAGRPQSWSSVCLQSRLPSRAPLSTFHAHCIPHHHPFPSSDPRGCSSPSCLSTVLPVSTEAPSTHPAQCLAGFGVGSFHIRRERFPYQAEGPRSFPSAHFPTSIPIPVPWSSLFSFFSQIIPHLADSKGSDDRHIKS